MDILDVEHRLDMVQEAAKRYVERRTIEVWESFFAELESVPPGVDLDALRGLHDWAVERYFETQNMIGAEEAAKERGMPVAYTRDEVDNARLVNGRAEKLAQRIEELVPAVTVRAN